MFANATTAEVVLRGFALYAAAGGIAMLTGPAAIVRMMADLKDQSLVRWLAGIVLLALGVAILAIAPGWTGAEAVIASLAGWGMLVEGLLFLAWPAPLLAIVDRFTGSERMMRIWGIVALVFALILAAIDVMA